MMYQAGQVGVFEGILILIGVLWLAGFLRSVIYVPVVIKEKEKQPEPESKEKTTRKIDPGGEYTDYEEIK
ncbi:MAG: hypothetical protein ACHQF2_04150 [Flavobacteriales bacterium]